MTRKTMATEESETCRSVDAEAAIMLLEKQIEKARTLLNDRKISSADLAIWHQTTREWLVRIYGFSSPNINTIIYAPGEGAVWMGMPDAIHERYKASSIINKIERLDSCIVQLRKQIETSDDISVEDKKT